MISSPYVLTSPRNDTDLQLLSCPLPSSPTKPRSKRAKVSEKEENPNIQSRVASSRYNTLQDFLSDFEKASTAIIERNQPQPNGDQPVETPMAKTVDRVAAFKKLLNNLLRQEYATQPDIKAEPSDDDADTLAGSAGPNTETRNGHAALTLFGNPSNPKQLYSSLQKSAKVSLLSSQVDGGAYVEVQGSLREDALPNGITATRISPYNPESRAKEPKRTFGEVFAPRPTLPKLEPPRRARSSSRNALNSWVDPLDALTNLKSFTGERTNYCLAPLPAGQWLQYGGVTSSPAFWERRQKRLSSDQPGGGDVARGPENSTLPTDDDSSILQGVYSSFAPSFDSSGAVVQADSKDLVWWGKRGARRLSTLLAMQYEEPDGETTAQPGNIGELDDDTLEEMVNNFKPEDLADNSPQVDASNKDEEDTASKDLDEILREISELLETLSSYQRIRNLDLPATGAKDGEPKEASPDEGDPSTPSAAERGVYETLKSGLAAMISNLPPYAVAKLDGDQLDDLNISQKILVENPDYHGTMERDDFTLQQESAAATGSSTGGANRNSTPRSAGYNQRVYHPGARIQQAQGSFQTPQYYGGRQLSMSGAYTTGHPSAYPGARPPGTPSQRAGYVSGYPPPGQQYSQGSAPQFQRPTPNGYNPYSSQQGAASPSPYTPRPAAYNVSYGTGRSTSPQKPPYGIPQSRTPNMNPGSANSQQRCLPRPQQPSRTGDYSSNQINPWSSYTSTPTGIAYSRRSGESTDPLQRYRDRNQQRERLASVRHSTSSRTGGLNSGPGTRHRQ